MFIKIDFLGSGYAYKMLLFIFFLNFFFPILGLIVQQDGIKTFVFTFTVGRFSSYTRTLIATKMDQWADAA